MYGQYGHLYHTHQVIITHVTLHCLTRLLIDGPILIFDSCSYYHLSAIVPTSITSNPACGCMINLATTNAFYRCQYNNPTVQSNFNQALPDYFTAFMADIITARYVIFAFGFILAILLALFFSHLLRFECVGLVVVWTGIGLTVVFMAVATGVCWWRATQWMAENPQIHSTNARIALQVFSILLLALTVLFMCACVFLRRSINLAIKVVALAATALESMILLIFTPLLNVTGLAVFLVPCLFYAFNVASNGSFTTQYYTYVNPITRISTQVSTRNTEDHAAMRFDSRISPL